MFGVILLGFSAAFQYLIKDEDVSKVAECADMMERLNLLQSGMLVLIEGMLHGDVSEAMACTRDVKGGGVGPALFYLFLIFSVLLLLNMIIAMMGRTFDDYAAQASQEACVYFARIVHDWFSETTQPPPFNALALLWPFFAVFVWLARALGVADPHLIEPPPSSATTTDAVASPLVRELLHDSSGRSTLELWRSKGPRDAPSLESLKSAVGDSLQNCFGEWETTAFLIDRAVKTLTEEISWSQQQLSEKLTREVAALRLEMQSQLATTKASGLGQHPRPRQLPAPKAYAAEGGGGGAPPAAPAVVASERVAHAVASFESFEA